MVIDASVWIAALLVVDAHYPVASRWLNEVGKQTETLAIPATCLAEVAGAIARRRRQPAQGLRLAQTLTALPHLELVEIDEALGREGMRFAANLRLRGADALYVAVAARLGVPLVTFDQELASRAALAVDVITPS
ncbi:MAG TPA: type II toxin-antitoxin system VapC family toxin [Chloroflexota bacterium]|nr:type II toxin-antitoxin system VapC family toxin [Chloroflexota bacterium]